MPRRRQGRLDWLRRHDPRIWRRRQWHQVLFTDELKFNLYRADGRPRVYRRKNERFADCCVIERDRFGGGNVMVCGGIAYGRRTPLHVIHGNMNALKYRDEILAPLVVPFVHQHNLTLQQDNARPHVARLCSNFLQTNNVDVLPWPAFSPDLYPIEHLWDELDKRVRRRPNPPTNIQDLEHALLQEWNDIPQVTINKLINSMTRRVQAAIDANGGHTRF